VSKKSGAGFARHKSAQDLGTPREFLDTVEARFGIIKTDLAAHAGNHVCARYFGPGSAIGENSLEQDWSRLTGNAWLNPEFEHIPLWAEKIARECKHRQAWSFFLVPASVDSNWFQQIALPNSHVLELTDRIQFVGSSDPYPKGLILACFGFGIVGRTAWHWDSRKTKAWERTPKAKKTRAAKAEK
jgi:phage N-6-adenine-methyltransferase